MRNGYLALKKQVYRIGNYEIVPVRWEDRFKIMQWRNEQIYHLRQDKVLNEEDQNKYFSFTIAESFQQNRPNQILFSMLEDGKCIGYGGLVHINWTDKNAELSFIMNTELEKHNFQKHWSIFLELVERVSFEDLKFHKIFTYAFDLRPQLYEALEKAGFTKEARLNEHCLFNGKYIGVVIHSKIN
jgi:RimJ/RimL family protein N-acetyltransferase